MASSINNDEDDFDLRVRMALLDQTPPCEPPKALQRVVPWHARLPARLGGLAFMLLALLVPLELMRPEALVRDAIEHEYFERTLRGQFMSSRPLLDQLGLAPAAGLPGYSQLVRPCEISGRAAYHLTTFFEKGGLVTLFAFKEPTALADGSGWWGNVHWQVIRSRHGQPLILVAQKRQALEAAQLAFKQSQAPHS